MEAAKGEILRRLSSFEISNVYLLFAFASIKKREKLAALAKAKDQRKQEFKSGRGTVSGREMFEFNPDLVDTSNTDADELDEDFDLTQFRKDDDVSQSPSSRVYFN